MADKLIQKSGNYSPQIQVETVNIIGISENRAREIFLEMSESKKRNISIEANQSISRVLPSGAWTHLNEIEKTYDIQFKNFINLTDEKEYDLASNIYWKILYYSGYRENWAERAVLSNKMLTLSEQVKDGKSSGLILAKGIAYSYMAREQYGHAEHILEQAHEYFLKKGTRQDMGVYYEYMGDIFNETSQCDKAIDFYKKARNRYEGLDQIKTQLKLSFLNAKYADINDIKQIDFLNDLLEQFKVMKNYREGLVAMEIARRFNALKETNRALFMAGQAYNFFNVINMPRNTKKANDLLQNIRITGNGINYEK
ncbi:hypothetical protein FACS189485_20420 [Spirochaetia bacterium]|nr:hypothetical protein FACS189485_20420 [Spirochaetia bacterium]